jgi:hypothetical protein
MARLLLTADPRRQSVVLAIDDADTLPRQSLYYLALMSEAMGAPILQIVFAAGPALLNTLSRPEFETFRNCIAYAGELTEPWQAYPIPQSIAPRSVSCPSRLAASLRLSRGFRGTVKTAAAVLAVGALVGIGYLVFLAPAPSVKSGAPQELTAATVPLDPRQTDEVIAALIDKAEAAIAQGSFGSGRSASWSR